MTPDDKKAFLAGFCGCETDELKTAIAHLLEKRLAERDAELDRQWRRRLGLCKGPFEGRRENWRSVRECLGWVNTFCKAGQAAEALEAVSFAEFYLLGLVEELGRDKRAAMQPFAPGAAGGIAERAEWTARALKRRAAKRTKGAEVRQ